MHTLIIKKNLNILSRALLLIVQIGLLNVTYEFINEPVFKALLVFTLESSTRFLKSDSKLQISNLLYFNILENLAN